MTKEETTRRLSGMVTSVYVGDRGRCACGCSGEHLGAGEEGFDEALAETVEMMLALPGGVEDLGSCLSLEEGPELRVVYLG